MFDVLSKNADLQELMMHDLSQNGSKSNWNLDKVCSFWSSLPFLIFYFSDVFHFLLKQQFETPSWCVSADYGGWT